MSRRFAEYLAETCWTIVQREKLPSFATVFLADAVGGGDEEEIEDEGNGNTDLPTSCECDNTHEQNGTVCRFCYEEDDDMSERDAKLLRKVGGAE